jgi:TatD DNase family protein
MIEHKPHFIDTHAHLDQPEFDADRADVLQRARRAGVEAIVCVGTTAASSRAVVELAGQYPDLYPAVGIQPNECAAADAGDWQQIVALAADPRVIALGETGLDRYWDHTPFDVQQDYFDRHLRLAQLRNLPVIIHCREADADLLPMLREAAARGPISGVLHAFGGAAETARECLELGLFVSFAGNASYANKKFEPLRAVAAAIPAERILLETDSPYLTPHPLRGKQQRNEPACIVHTATSLAALRGVPLETLAAQTAANARRLFRLAAPS